MKSFEEVWAKKEAQGYRYGPEALEQVRLGFELARNEQYIEQYDNNSVKPKQARKELLGYLLSIAHRTLICAISEKFIHCYEQELFNGDYGAIDAMIAKSRA